MLLKELPRARVLMEHKHNHSRHHSYNGKNFIILPIIFCVLINLICYLMLAPSLSAFVSVGSLFFSDAQKDFSKDFNNIFVPVSEPSNTDSKFQKSPSQSIMSNLVSLLLKIVRLTQNCFLATVIFRLTTVLAFTAAAQFPDMEKQFLLPATIILILTG